MSTKTTLLLSKEEVVSKLESLHFSFEEHYWESFQQSHQVVKTPSNVSTQKFSAKLIAIPAIVVLAGVIIYFSVNTLQSQNKNSETKNLPIETTALENTTAPKSIPVSTESVTNSPSSPTQALAVPVSNSKPSTTPQASSTPIKEQSIPKEEPKPTQTARVAAPVVNEIPKPEVTNNLPTEAKTTKNYSEPKIIKKHKRDKKTTPPPLVPSPEEDNVVIPEN